MSFKQIIQMLITSYIFGLVLLSSHWKDPNLQGAMIFAAFFTLAVYWMIDRYDRMREKERKIAIRSSMTFIQQWPGKGWVDLGERYDDLYTVILNPERSGGGERGVAVFPGESWEPGSSSRCG